MMQSAPANTVKSAAIWTGFARFQEEEGAEADAALPEQHRFFLLPYHPRAKNAITKPIRKNIYHI